MSKVDKNIKGYLDALEIWSIVCDNLLHLCFAVVFLWKQNCDKKDPINLVFDHMHVNDIMTYLLSKKWMRTFFACFHFLPSKSNLKNKSPEEASLIQGSLFKRYHMRLWGINDELVVANIHYDKFSLTTGHKADRYEEAEKLIASQFECDGFNILLDAIELGNAVKCPFNNGAATKIWR